MTDLSGSANRDEGYWDAVRRHFSFPPDLVYMQNASRGPMPLFAVDALANYARELAADPRRIIDAAAAQIEEVRRRAAAFLGADTQEIALTRSTTHGINIVARGLALSAGDEVVVGSHEHPCCLEPWRVRASQDGIDLRTVDIRSPIEDPASLLERFERAITRRTRVIMASQVTYTTGAMMPIRELSELAHQHGALLVVDGAQVLGMLATDLHDLGCDVWSAGGGKWLMAPAGTGFLYIKRDVQKAINPKWVSIGWDDESKGAGRYEVFESWGERSIPEIRTLGDLMEFHTAIEPEHVEARVQELGRRLAGGLWEVGGVDLLSPSAPHFTTGITSFSVAKKSGEEVASILYDRHGIHVRPLSVEGRSTVRVSTHVYNHPSEIDLIIDEVGRQAMR